MPVADTELLFALNPRDPKHHQARSLLASTGNLYIPDVTLLEFELVLRGRGRTPRETAQALLALREVLLDAHALEARTLDTTLLTLHCELEAEHNLSFFDSLIAASALSLDAHIVSDDRAFDRVPGLKRLPLA